MKKLNEGFKIKNTVINNRVCVPPMVVRGYSDEQGLVSEKNIEHYKMIAKGKPGLIIQEATCVSANGKLSNDQLGIWDDIHIEGLKKIVEAVHQENCPIFVQIHHAGIVGIAKNVICPDNYTYNNLKTAKRMTIDQIKEVQQDFIDAGIRAYKAGYDGVELHGCHRYLICQFLNKNINKRDDVYGKNPEKLVFEIMDGIKKNTSQDFIIGIRLGAFESTLLDSIRHAKNLAEHGIDFLNISYGFFGEDEPYKPDNYPLKDVIWAASEIKKHVNVPVFVVNGIRTPAEAKEILTQTNTDMVNIGRSILVDNNWAIKANNNEEPGKCLWCAKCMWRMATPQLCPGRIILNRKVTVS